VIILDYRAVVYLVASVDTEQQTQSRSTCHVQKTTNTTEINRRTTRNYALGDLSTQILKISRLLEATDSSQRLLMFCQLAINCKKLNSGDTSMSEMTLCLCIELHRRFNDKFTSAILKCNSIL
jgi:hypothetical protein